MLTYRFAQEQDIDIYFNWANDSNVRESAFNSKVIEYSNHCSWFRSKVESEDSHLYLFLNNGEPSGQVRIDIKESEGFIDISIDKSSRGLKLGHKMLLLASDNLLDQYEELILIAEIKIENIASIKSFEKAGFIKFDNKKSSDIVVYKKSRSIY